MELPDEILFEIFQITPIFNWIICCNKFFDIFVYIKEISLYNAKEIIKNKNPYYIFLPLTEKNIERSVKHNFIEAVDFFHDFDSKCNKLFYAIKHNNKEIITKVLYKFRNYNIALEIASQLNNKEYIEFFETKSSNLTHGIIGAIRSGNKKLIEYFIRK